MDDSVNLFSLLSLPETADKNAVDGAYALLNKISPSSQSIRLAWKILRDDNYRTLYKNTRSLNSVYSAGFFDDHEDDDNKWLNEDVRLLVTPYHKIINRISLMYDEQPGVILLTTGSFSPLHQGHIDMMEQAKNFLEEQGRTVLGGYIVPAHDSYVAVKSQGQAGMSAQLRIHLAQMSVQNSGWIMVDGSEALCNPCDRNFTDVVRRLKKYITYHFPLQQFQFYYVCGEDVAPFSFAFEESGECLCVGRSLAKEIAISKNSTFIPNQSSSKESSSSLVRSGEHQLLSLDAVDLYKKWLSTYNTIGEHSSKNNFYYHLRYEGIAFYKQWLLRGEGEEKELVQALNIFKKKLTRVLQKAFLDSIPPSIQVHVKVSQIYFDSQVRKLSRLHLDKKTISMDQCYQGDYTLGVSRLFALSDGQFFGEKLVPRPGMPELSQQISVIPEGEYYLIEDDIGSGQTMNLVKKTLPPNIVIKDIILMNRFNGDLKEKDELDIVDMRDFILGSKDGGLVSMLSSGEIIRVPYMYPYVNLVKRAKIPFFNTLRLSLDLWKLNYDFYKSFSRSIIVKDLFSNSSSLFLQQGFNESTLLTDVCLRHIRLLERMIEYQKMDFGIEFYHVYDDEGLVLGGGASLELAKDRIKEISDEKKSYCITLLIDDYRSKNFLIKKEKRDGIHHDLMEKFHTLSQSHGVSIDFFAFESMMIKVAKKIVRRIPKNLIVKDYYKKKKSYITMLKNQGFKIGLVELWEDDIKYSCALLSAAWILCRLGEEMIPSDRLVSVRGKQFTAKKIITYLPKDYESTENKAKIILLSAGYGHVLPNIESIYY